MFYSSQFFRSTQHSGAEALLRNHRSSSNSLLSELFSTKHEVETWSRNMKSATDSCKVQLETTNSQKDQTCELSNLGTLNVWIFYLSISNFWATQIREQFRLSDLADWVTCPHEINFELFYRNLFQIRASSLEREMQIFSFKSSDFNLKHMSCLQSARSASRLRIGLRHLDHLDNLWISRHFRRHLAETFWKADS